MSAQPVIKFDFKKVTIGDKKAFRRISGVDWTGYPWGKSSVPAEEQAAVYYVVMRQNAPVAEDAMDQVTEEELLRVLEAMFPSMADEKKAVDPTNGSTSTS